MTKRLFIFTASNPKAYQHYIDTIEKGIALQKVKPFLDDETFEKLKAIYGSQQIRVWGAVPGSQNIKNWKKLDINDRVLIYRKKHYEYFATVTYKTHNQKLARYLWGEDFFGKTWEYIYFLDDLTDISVPHNIFNQVLGYQSSYLPMGFNSIKQTKVEDLRVQYGSVDEFLRFLEEGKWVTKSTEFTSKIKEKIIEEKTARTVERTSLLEANLENFLAERIEQLEKGLILVARQLDTKEVGRLDLLCRDKEKSLVVVELKKMRAGSSIIDQIQRYMGWVMDHKAKKGQKVKGIIVVGKKDTALEYAVKANPLIKVKSFSVHFD